MLVRRFAVRGDIGTFAFGFFVAAQTESWPPARA
jgi:hypothetical protein